MRINNNVAAFNAYRNLSTTQGQLGKSLEKLSSGFRINRAADDAAGLAKSEGLRAEIKGTQQAVKNAQDGISLVQTAEGALNEVHSILQRMRELAVSAANTATTEGAEQQAEVNELLAELDAIGTRTQFAGQSVFSDEARVFQVGANTGDTLSVSIGELSAEELDLTGLDITNLGDPEADPVVASAIDDLDAAIETISDTRSNLGASQNRLEHTISNLQVAAENLQASESRIRDADMAEEMVGFTRNQILQQAGTAMLAQANQVPQSVLSLL